MKLSALTWPHSAQAIQQTAEAVTAQIATNMNEAVGRLTPLTGKANYSRHPLSGDAVSLAGLETELAGLLVQGQILTVSPYQFQVGEQQPSGAYLNPQTAMESLTAKLREQVDKNRPTGELHCIAIMLCESQLTRFATSLTELTQVLSLPAWCQVARQATALSSNEIDKFHQVASIIQPRFKPQAYINANPLRALQSYQGAELATLSSLANDQQNVIEKLQGLANKRSEKLVQIKTKIDTLKKLKQLNGKVWSITLTGSCESLATQLTQSSLPSNAQYTIASLLISQQPLTFFEELLCSA